MPGPALSSLNLSSETLPDRVDVVVIGGGIVGIATAYFLQKRGFSVVVCEKGEIAGEQSSRNWGWCRVSQRDPLEVPIALEARRIWRGLDPAVQGETGYSENGSFFAGDTEKDIHLNDRWLADTQQFDLSSRVVTQSEIARILPGSVQQIRSGIYTPDDGWAEPQKATTALAKAVLRSGGRILTYCAARTLDIQAGCAKGVVTERGLIQADAVVLAGGAWSSLFASAADLRLPQLRIHATVLRTSPCSEGPSGAAWLGPFAIRKRLDGGFTIAQGVNRFPIVPDAFKYARDFIPAFRQKRGALRLTLNHQFIDELLFRRPPRPDKPTVFEKVRILDPEPVTAAVTNAIQAAKAFFPFLHKTSVTQAWGGIVDATPDALPVISGVESIPGLFMATGFSGHGFGIGPAAGQLCADLITGDKPVVDARPFRFSRFSDGSIIKPYVL